jgi:hypothetical protein
VLSAAIIAEGKNTKIVIKESGEMEKRERAFAGKPVWKSVEFVSKTCMVLDRVWKYLGVSRDCFWMKTKTESLGFFYID